MKKILAITLSLALLLSALFTLTASAEDAVTLANTTSAVMARGGRGGQMPGGNRGNGQMPQMPGNNNRNNQMPQLPGNNGNNQMPQMPGNNNGQMPQLPGNNGSQTAPTAPTDGTSSATQTQPQQPANGNGFKGGKFGGFGHRGGMRVSFEQLLKDGVITQETYDAIIAYIQKNAPAAPAASTDGTAPAAPADGTAPAAPADGTAPAAPADGTAPEAAPSENPVLSDLLKDGVITQEQYDAIVSASATTASDLPVDTTAEGTAN